MTHEKEHCGTFCEMGMELGWGDTFYEIGVESGSRIVIWESELYA